MSFAGYFHVHFRLSAFPDFFSDRVPRLVLFTSFYLVTTAGFVADSLCNVNNNSNNCSLVDSSVLAFSMICLLSVCFVFAFLFTIQYMKSDQLE